MLNIGPEINTVIGKPLETGEKIFYPVVKISTLKSNGNIKAVWAVPIAIVVEEESEMFLIPLTYENIDFNEIF